MADDAKAAVRAGVPGAAGADLVANAYGWPVAVALLIALDAADTRIPTSLASPVF